MCRRLSIRRKTTLVLIKMAQILVFGIILMLTTVDVRTRAALFWLMKYQELIEI
jgi:hypothetical protein